MHLWPEHFDVACDLARGPGERERANLGGSAGDDAHPEPCLHLGPDRAQASSRRRAARAARWPHMPCTPPPGGVEAEHR